MDPKPASRGKDILHRIAKLQQNQMLKKRDPNNEDLQIDPTIHTNALAFQLDFDDEQVDAEEFYIGQQPCKDKIQHPSPLENTESHGNSEPNEVKMKVFCFEEEEEQQDAVDRSQAKRPSVGPDRLAENFLGASDPEEIEEPGREQSVKQDEKQNLENNKPVIEIKEEGKKRKKFLGVRKMPSWEGFEKTSKEKPKQEQGPSSSGEDGESDGSGESEGIKGVRITSNPLEGNVTINIVNKKELAESPLPPGIALNCIIRRSPNFINPEFDIYLHNGLKHIMSAKKYSLSKCDVFKIYSEMGKYTESCQIATITANTVHNNYWVTTPSSEEGECSVRGLITYEKLVKDKARKMNVQLIDRDDVVGETKKMSFEGPSFLEDEGPLELISQELTANQNSIKNFILVDEDDNEYEYLKMRKLSDNMFEMMIQHPLTPLQAFAIGLTRFDAELK